MKNVRLVWLDIAKGIAIILMVLGHSELPVWLNRFIWTFHMPLFFIAAGITNDFNQPLGLFLKRKSRTLLLPFAIYSVIVLLLEAVLESGSFWDTLQNLTIEFLKIGWYSGTALWFIPVLFLALVVVRLTFTIKNKTLQYAMWVLIPLISIDLSHYGIQLPWKMSSVPFATAFILIGYFTKATFPKTLYSKLGGGNFCCHHSFNIMLQQIGYVL